MSNNQNHWVTDLIGLARTNATDAEVSITASVLTRLFDLSMIEISAPGGETITANDYLLLDEDDAALHTVGPSSAGRRLIHEIEAIEKAEEQARIDQDLTRDLRTLQGIAKGFGDMVAPSSMERLVSRGWIEETGSSPVAEYGLTDVGDQMVREYHL